MRIIRNSVKCKKCKNVIESKSEYGRVECKCGAVTIAGGKEMLIRYGKQKNFIDTSLIEVDYERKVK